MTKYELNKKVEVLERDLHNAENSIEHWKNEAEYYNNKLIELQNKIGDDSVLSFLENCSITQKQQLEDFIKTL